MENRLDTSLELFNEHFDTYSTGIWSSQSEVNQDDGHLSRNLPGHRDSSISILIFHQIELHKFSNKVNNTTKLLNQKK